MQFEAHRSIVSSTVVPSLRRWHARCFPATSMGRPLRWLRPGTTWFVTSRCFQARLLLRPDPQLTGLAGLWLARAAGRFPGVRVLGALVLSNHAHLIVHDTASELSRFLDFFFGNLAKAANRLRNRSGTFFERRFSAEPILDEDALAGRMIYLLLNPVQAGLVERHDDWPGLCLWADKGGPRSETFRVFDQPRYERARRTARAGGPKVSPADFYSEETLTVQPLALTGDGPVSGVAARILAEVRRQEGKLREDRLKEGKGVLGAAGVLAQDPESAPRRPKRGRRPLCHTSCRRLWEAFRTAVRALGQAYRAASAAFRGTSWWSDPIGDSGDCGPLPQTAANGRGGLTSLARLPHHHSPHPGVLGKIFPKRDRLGICPPSWRSGEDIPATARGRSAR
jgi:REP element-mobilizing transposase RayT